MFKSCSSDGEKCSGCCSCPDWGLLVLRIAMGIIFIMAGYSKLFTDAPGIEGFTGMLAGLNIPAPAVAAWLVAIIEFFGGIALVLGVFTRIVAKLLAIIMLVAFVMVKQGFPEGNLDLTLFAMAVSLALMGPGNLALMKDMCKKKGMDEKKSEEKPADIPADK